MSDPHVMILTGTMLRQSEVSERLQDEAYSANRYRQKIAWLKGKPDETVIHAKDFIDRRKGYATLFNYCPYTGEQINWRKIRKQLDT